MPIRRGWKEVEKLQGPGEDKERKKNGSFSGIGTCASGAPKQIYCSIANPNL